VFKCTLCGETQPHRANAHRVVTAVRVDVPDAGAPHVQIQREERACLVCAVQTCELLPVHLVDLGSVLSAEVRRDLIGHGIRLPRYADAEAAVVRWGLPTEQELRGRLLDAAAVADTADAA